MVTLSIFTTAATLLLCRLVQASPLDAAATQVPSNPEQAEMLATFLKEAPRLFPNDPLKNQKDDRYPHMCEVYMETTNGGHCRAYVNCENKKIHYNPDRKFCSVGGRQYMNDPRIGEFSITYAEKDGKDQGQGLTTPILQVKNISNWLEIPVEGVAKEFRKKRCDEHKFYVHGDDCGKGPFVCRRGKTTKPFSKSRIKVWTCAIPY